MEVAGTERGVNVVVVDQGPGIAQSILPNLFQFGFTTKGSLGNGMGLWTAKHILDRHYGEIDVQSHPVRGTRVEIKWPRSFLGYAKDGRFRDTSLSEV